MRLLILAFFFALPSSGCFCLTTDNSCGALSGSTVVFVGRVLVDSGEGWGTGPARVLVEKPLFNVPKAVKEFEIDTSAGTSCYYRLKAGERYVVFAGRAKSPSLSLSMGSCSNTFLLSGNEYILKALRNQAQSGPSRLVGAVRRSTGPYSHAGGIPGAVVTAHSATAAYQAITGDSGAYEIWGVAPGRYEVEVSKPGFAPDTEYNQRWSGRMVLNKATNTIEPDETKSKWSIVIGEKSCEVRDLSLWPRGRISGIVTGITGEPLSGITVQAFGFDKKGQRESRPLRTATTTSEGRYTIEPLPGGKYVVAVNAEDDRDVEAFPPTESSRIQVTDGQEAANINLLLPAKRVGTTLRVRVLGPSGTPYAGALVTLENLSGVQRWYSDKKTAADGTVDVPAYVGEQYIINAQAFDAVRNPAYDYLGGSARADVANESPSAVVVISPKRYSDSQ